MIHIPRLFIPLRRAPTPPPSPAGTAPYAPGDAQWLTSFCMLCPRTGTVVAQIGVVDADGTHMPLLACLDCHQKISLMAHTWWRIRDGSAPPDALRAVHAHLSARQGAA